MLRCLGLIFDDKCIYFNVNAKNSNGLKPKLHCLGKPMLLSSQASWQPRILQSQIRVAFTPSIGLETYQSVRQPAQIETAQFPSNQDGVSKNLNESDVSFGVIMSVVSAKYVSQTEKKNKDTTVPGPREDQPHGMS